MYILYSGQLTVGLAVEMVLEELGLDYERREVDIVKGENRSPDYLAINPAGWVPALITPEGQILHETPAIMLYLADRHGRPNLVPDFDDPERGLFYARLFSLANDMHPAMKRYYYAQRYSTDPADTPRIKAQALITARDRWQVLDDHLKANGPYLMGSRFTVADIYMCHFAGSGFDAPLSLLEEFPAVRACYDLLAARPRIGDLLRRTETMMERYLAATSGPS
jgi:glutathione S-transferase